MDQVIVRIYDRFNEFLLFTNKHSIANNFNFAPWFLNASKWNGPNKRSTVLFSGELIELCPVIMMFHVKWSEWFLINHISHAQSNKSMLYSYSHVMCHSNSRCPCDVATQKLLLFFTISRVLFHRTNIAASYICGNRWKFKFQQKLVTTGANWLTFYNLFCNLWFTFERKGERELIQII